LIREVILENFMSYEYARVPLKPGVNVVCGPNGSGKSSLLTGISVALGQSYTERSRRLSDLIRWGKDVARVTLVLDNSRRGGRRPIPQVNKDSILLSRVLRRDGKYWFELDNQAATKERVTRLLSRLGVDPDNMLVIMHQNMVDEFSVLSPREKLGMVEAAVGLEPYRRNVLKARQKLSRILSQEESVGKLLESAEQTLRYWREQYDRFQQKKQLLTKRRFLERELTWAEITQREEAVNDLKGRIQEKEREIQHLGEAAETADGRIKGLEERMERLRAEWRRLLGERLSLEGQRARHEASISLASQTSDEVGSWAESTREGMKEFRGRIEALEGVLRGASNPDDLGSRLEEVRKAFEGLGSAWAERFDLKRKNLRGLVESSTAQVEELGARITEAEGGMDGLGREMEGVSGETVDGRIRLAILQYQEKALTGDLNRLKRDLQGLEGELEGAVKRALETGPRIATVKAVEEILDEMRVTDGHLAALADVSEDIERMYESYSKLYLELKEKAQQVAENREKALEEVKTRMEAWRDVIRTLLDHVNQRYGLVLSEAQAEGAVQLTDDQDIEEAGLEILVGFRGAEPLPLDAYTQSGGERSTATVAFLMALQQHVRSPFRAVDEYDTHMDPRNREVIANILVSSVMGSAAQYLAITPSQITFTEKDVHIITVQNVEGSSLIREVA